MTARRAVRLALALLAVGAWGGPAAGQAPPPAQEAAALLDYEQNTVQIMQRYGPSVVTVGVEVQGRRLGPFEGLPEEQIPPQYRNLPPQLRQGTGSGFVVDDERRIVTNLHVVSMALADGAIELRDAARLTVRYPGIDAEFDARVVGANALYDLALLELVDPAALPPEALARVSLPLADSDTVVPGQKAIAIGNPFGFENTVTVGTVSGLARHLVDVGQADLPFIQTDTAINPGNSGGPLLNSRGEVIGINTAILPGGGIGGPRGFIGLGFAIPSNVLAVHLAELRAGGLIDIDTTPRLGIGAIGLDAFPDAVRTQLGLPEAGVMVVEVEAGSGAAAAGLRGVDGETTIGAQAYPTGGDVITAVDGAPVATAGDLQRAILGRSEGEEVELHVWRDGEELRLRATVTRVP